MGCSACDTKDRIIQEQRSEIHRLARVIETLEDIIRRLQLLLSSLIAQVEAIREFGEHELTTDKPTVKPRWKLPWVLIGRLQVALDNARNN